MRVEVVVLAITKIRLISHPQPAISEIPSRLGLFSNGPQFHTTSHGAGSDEKHICQICSKPGHMANLCYR
jgi:hypothetical protein